MPLIKSHSNFVLKSKHQEVNDGTIWERDITTIGGISSFPSGQVPVYNSGNFIITVRNDRGAQNKYNKSKWISNDSGDTWTIENVDALVSSDETQDDTKIVLKQDYYDLRDFAYYGSLSELFRSSVGDILTRFPGELYQTDHTVTYIDYSSGTPIEKDLLGESYKELSNPYGIDIHSKSLPENASLLKYFADGGWKNYEYISADGAEPEPITSWTSTLYVKKVANASTLDAMFGVNGANDLFYMQQGRYYANAIRSRATSGMLTEDQYYYENRAKYSSDGLFPVEWQYLASTGNMNAEMRPYIGKKWIADMFQTRSTTGNLGIVSVSGKQYTTEAECRQFISEKHSAVDRAWDGYKTCASGQYTAYTNKYNSYINTYNSEVQDAIDTRDLQYEMAATARTKAYEIATTAKTKAYEDAESDKEIAYHNAETAKTQAYSDAETAKTKAYSDADSARTDAYDDAQETKDEKYRDAESARTDAYDAALETKNGAYHDAENVSATTKSDEDARHDGVLNDIQTAYNQAVDTAQSAYTACTQSAEQTRDNAKEVASSTCESKIAEASGICEDKKASALTAYNECVSGANEVYSSATASCHTTWVEAKDALDSEFATRREECNEDPDCLAALEVEYQERKEVLDSASGTCSQSAASDRDNAISACTTTYNKAVASANTEFENSKTAYIRERNRAYTAANNAYSGATGECKTTYDNAVRDAERASGQSYSEENRFYTNNLRTITNTYNAAIRAADEAYFSATHQADEDCAAAKSVADGIYQAAILVADNEYSAATQAADNECIAAKQEADTQYDNAISAADDKYERDIQKADDDYDDAIETADATYTHDIQVADNEYAAAITAAKNKRDSSIKQARIDYINVLSGNCEQNARSIISGVNLTYSGYVSPDSVYATTDNVYLQNFNRLANYGSYASSMANNDHSLINSQFRIFDAITCTDPTCYVTDFCSPDHIGNVQINGKQIEVAVGDDRQIFYLYSGTTGFHIRPKAEFLNEFYNGCSNFQRLLVDPTTTPKYKATFSVIKENDFGYYRELEDFIFPIAEGGYNLNADSYGFTQYTKHMAEVGEYYDEFFTDNLYRNMTHESIKNFDWTRRRVGDQGIDEDVELGADKMRKMLRIVAREFDEVKSYIDGIKNVNSVTYDERNNIPDYFLSDTLSDDGWDVKNVYPYMLDERFLNADNEYEMVQDEDYSGTSGETQQLTNTDPSNTFHIERLFSQNTKIKVKPYSSKNEEDEYVKNGYFMSCCGGSTAKEVANGPIKVCPNGNGVSFRIKQYSSEKEYSVFDAGYQFLRNMKINSIPILRHKGTIEGIEMVLGMFGLKSSRYSPENYDYKITEYSSFTKRIEDKWLEAKQMYEIDWYNSTKTIQYDYKSEFSSFVMKPNMYLSYQGLPIAYRDKKESDNKIHRYLYPHFNKEEKIDGDPYFQMDGGWLAKSIKGTEGAYNFQYDVDDNVVYNKAYPRAITSTEDDQYVVDNAPIYKETVRAIRSVDTIKDLISLPSDSLYNGQICYVNVVEDNVMSIDGMVYEIHEEYSGSTNGLSKYILLSVVNSYVGVGDKYFNERMTVYDKYGQPIDYYIGDKEDGFEIKAYIKVEEDGTYSFICHDEAYGVDDYYVLTTGENDTNYFKIWDTTFSQNLSDYEGYGWKRLSTDSEEYKRINVVTNYYKGNNPHNGNLSYDSGHEYFTYFKRLFKYADDNDKFDERCFEDYFTAMGTIPTFGFSGLIDDNESVQQYTPYLIEDGKVHYFGHYKVVNETSSSSSSGRCDNIASVKIYTDDDTRLSGFRQVYSGITTEKYILNSKDDMVDQYDGYTDDSLNAHFNWPEDAKTDEVTDQVMNNKRMTIEFNLHNPWYYKEGQCELKYLDDIVMNYLTQVIPSTTIVDVVYYDEQTECKKC